MPYFVGLDASKRTTKICVMDPAGAVVKEGVTASEPKEIVAFLRGERRRYVTVGLESWSLAPTLHAGLSKAGLPAVMIEALHAHHM
ncbi:MAG: IS110 family transposase, partial [Proteobacteria bacterium]|nr:IS110 family transposase [Pseudomonadota bacterium]